MLRCYGVRRFIGDKIVRGRNFYGGGWIGETLDELVFTHFRTTKNVLRDYGFNLEPVPVALQKGFVIR